MRQCRYQLEYVLTQIFTKRRQLRKTLLNIRALFFKKFVIQIFKLSAAILEKIPSKVEQRVGLMSFSNGNNVFVICKSTNCILKHELS